MLRAAEREHITVSAVSRRIAGLEARSGIRLLDRKDRGAVPTSAGLDLAAGAKRVFELLDSLALDLNGLKMGVLGVVRLHAHMSAMTPELMRAIATFRYAYPGVDVVLEERTSIEVIHAVNSGSADLGLVSGTVEASGLNVLPWMRDELVAIVPTGHELATQRSLELAQLLRYPFIAMQRGSALLALFEQSARRIGLVLIPKAYLVNFESVRMMVTAKLGVSIVPKTWATAPGRGIVSLHLAETWSIREINLCFRNPTSLTVSSRSLLDHLAREAPRSEGPK